jgi:hypothetical protein
MPSRGEFLAMMGKTMDAELFVKAFNQAKDLRGRVLLQKTIFHSDHFFTI